METFLHYLVVCATIGWLALLLAPWRPWLTGETLEPGAPPYRPDDLTVLIPARNEADAIAATLQGLAAQGMDIRVALVDDCSSDGTADIARQASGIRLRLVEGAPLPRGWSGKLWALEQGIRMIETRWTLLLDADIRLAPGMIAALLDKARRDDRQFVSVMASLRMESFWEKLLMPAFVLFFKLLYPFRLANSPRFPLAAAAGGCILLETRLIREIGGFAALKDALIDDCALAGKIKATGARTWIGQSRSVVSQRRYESLDSIWEMVARSAFTQLRYSGWLLGLCTLLMLAMFWAPAIGLIWTDGKTLLWSLAAWFAMTIAYRPTLRYYGRTGNWAWLFPPIAALYLAMTWSSAIRYWNGVRSRWKERVYATQEE